MSNSVMLNVTLNAIALHRQPMSERRSVTRRMGSQCYLPLDTGERICFNLSQIGRYSIYLPRRDARL